MHSVNDKQTENTEDSFSSRDKVLQCLTETSFRLRKLAYQHRLGSRVQDRAYVYRTLIYCCSVQLNALKDRDIDCLKKEIEEIRQHVGMDEK